MAKVDELDRETEEEEEDYDDYFDGDEDEELDNDAEDDDDDDDYSKLVERAKTEATEEIVKQLSSGDQDSPVYKGLQKVISRKDQELNETRQALAGLAEHIQKNQTKSSEAEGTVEFLMETFKDALKPEDQRILADRFEEFKNKRTETSRLDGMEAMIRNISQALQGRSQSGESSQEDQFAEMRKQATEELKEIAREAGFDPEDDDLEYGDPQEPLLNRMKKLRTSIAKANGEVDKLKRKRRYPDTRKDGDIKPLYQPGDARRVLDQLSSNWVKQMRKNS